MSADQVEPMTGKQVVELVLAHVAEGVERRGWDIDTLTVSRSEEQPLVLVAMARRRWAGAEPGMSHVEREFYGGIAQGIQNEWSKEKLKSELDRMYAGISSRKAQ